MTPSMIITNLIWNLFKLVIVLGGIAATFFFFAISAAIVSSAHIPTQLYTVGWFTTNCALISMMLTLLNPKTTMRAGPLSLFAPWLDFEKKIPLMTLAAKSHTLLFWVWVGLFIWGDYITMPIIGAVAFLLLTPLAWQHAMTGMKAQSQT